MPEKEKELATLRDLWGSHQKTELMEKPKSKHKIATRQVITTQEWMILEGWRSGCGTGRQPATISGCHLQGWPNSGCTHRLTPSSLMDSLSVHLTSICLQASSEPSLPCLPTYTHIMFGLLIPKRVISPYRDNSSHCWKVGFHVSRKSELGLLVWVLRQELSLCPQSVYWVNDPPTSSGILVQQQWSNLSLFPCRSLHARG